MPWDSLLMPNLSVLTYSWTGAPVVGGGATVLHCQQGDENTAVTAFNVFLTAIRSVVALGVQWTPPVAGNVIDELSGNVVSSWSGGASGPITSSGGSDFVNGVGARVVWRTIGVSGGRHVRGSTFIVPLQSISYEGAGNIQGGTISILQGAASTLAGTPNAIRIYSRKTLAHGGISFPVSAGVAPDKVSWLRSRRT